MIDRARAIKIFEETNNFAETARRLGVCRQWAHRALKGLVIQKHNPKPHSIPKTIDMVCPKCKQTFRGRISRIKAGPYCLKCNKNLAFYTDPEFRRKQIERLKLYHREHRARYKLYNRKAYQRKKLLKKTLSQALDSLFKSDRINAGTG